MVWCCCGLPRLPSSSEIHACALLPLCGTAVWRRVFVLLSSFGIRPHFRSRSSQNSTAPIAATDVQRSACFGPWALLCCSTNRAQCWQTLDFKMTKSNPKFLHPLPLLPFVYKKPYQVPVAKQCFIVRVRLQALHSENDCNEGKALENSTYQQYFKITLCSLAPWAPWF